MVGVRFYKDWVVVNYTDSFPTLNAMIALKLNYISSIVLSIHFLELKLDTFWVLLKIPLRNFTHNHIYNQIRIADVTSRDNH